MEKELKETLEQIAKENACKKCGTTENVNFDGMCKECYEETLGVQKETVIERKSDFLTTTQAIIIGIAIVAGIMEMIFKSYILLATTIISAIVICIMLNIFKVIIDLLQSIDEKLDQ